MNKNFLEELKAILPQREDILPLAIFFVAYVAAAKLGVYINKDLAGPPAFISPAIGIALGIMFLGGYRMWPAIVLGALLNGIWNGGIWNNVLISIYVNTLQAI